jgi:hypothetical protein
MDGWISLNWSASSKWGSASAGMASLSLAICMKSTVSLVPMSLSMKQLEKLPLLPLVLPLFLHEKIGRS